jgi:hypothetical protein
MVAVLPSCLLGETKNIFDKHQPFIMNYFITKYKLMISNHLPLTRKPLIKCHQNGRRSATLTFSKNISFAPAYPSLCNMSLKIYAHNVRPSSSYWW